MTLNLSSIGLGAALSASTVEQEMVANGHTSQNPIIPQWGPPKGTWFDESYDLRDPEGGALVEAVLSIMDAAEERIRKRSVAADRNRHIRVRKLLANGLRCFYHRSPAWVAYLRKANSYGGKAAWLSGKALAKDVDQLAHFGLLETETGEFGTASTYRIGRTLFHLTQDHGVNDHSLTHCLPSESLVRLRSGALGSDQIPYEESDQTARWTALLESYNAFLTQHDIGLALSVEEEREWTEHINDKGVPGQPLYRPERIQTALYRQFSNGSFEQGGRMYGGWWITTPKRLRSRITINREPTAELDFSGCAIRMLYHERKMDYQGDPYHLDEIADHEAHHGLQAGYYREAIKAMTQAIINNSKANGRPEGIEFPNGLSFLPHFKRPKVRRMIEQKHAPIADAFGTGAGVRLQRADSDLALSIISELREEGVLALPIHDSFIVQQKELNKLIFSMNSVYHKMFGCYPQIK